MPKSRVESFSDGVIAILITIMVLELHPPEQTNWHALHQLWPAFFTYVLSFMYLGIYWNNHHHMFQAVERVSGGAMWANLHLLFWLSLVPFLTEWMGQHHFAALPTAIYGFVLLMCAVAFTILQLLLVHQHGANEQLAEALEGDVKGKVSLVFYVAAIPLSFVAEWLALALYVSVALIWFIPDRRIERKVVEELG